MQDTISGRIYKFGDNVNSDIIIAGRYLIYIDPAQLANPALHLQPDPQGPDVLELERCLLPNELALVPRLAVRGIAFGFHDGLPSS